MLLASLPSRPCVDNDWAISASLLNDAVDERVLGPRRSLLPHHSQDLSLNTLVSVLGDEYRMKLRANDAGFTRSARWLSSQPQLERESRNVKRVSMTRINPDGVGKVE